MRKKKDFIPFVIPACLESFFRFRTDPQQIEDKSRKDCVQAAMTEQAGMTAGLTYINYGFGKFYAPL